MNKLEQHLRNAKPVPLSDQESVLIWRATAQRLPKQPVRTVAIYSLIRNPMFATIAAIIIVLVGGGATVAAADNARPGDALYGIDTATERVRLAIASEDKKVELKAKFAAERAEEAEELIAEAEEEQTTDDSTTATSTDDGSTVSTSTDDMDDERDDDTNKQKERAATATINAITTLTGVQAELEAKGNTVAAEAIAETLARLEAKVQASNTVRTRVQVEQDDDGEKVRVEVKQQNRESSDDEDEDPSDENQSLEIEVKVYGDQSTAKVEMRSGKQTVQLSATTRDEIIAALAAELGVSESDVAAVLKIEQEDRDEQENKDDDNGNLINDIVEIITLRKIEVEVEDGKAKVEAKYTNDRDKEFRIESGTEAEMDAKIAEELGITVEAAAALTVYKR